MPSYRTKVGPHGQIALPPDLVDRLNVREGAEVEFFLTLDGDVFFHAITGIAAGWKGLFPTEIRSPPMSIKEMDEDISEKIAEEHDRIRRQEAPAQERPRAKKKSAAE